MDATLAQYSIRGTPAGSHRRRADPWMLLAVACLLGLSALMVFSATTVISQELYGHSLSLIKRHLLHMLVGLIAFAVFFSINPLQIRRFAVAGLAVTVVLLVLVLIPGLGHSAGGAQRWFQFGPLRMQPGELAKIMLMIYFAAYIERYRDRMQEFFPGVLLPFAISGTVAALLLLEPDFGSTVVLMTVVFCQLFTAANIKHLLGLGIAGLGAAVVLISTSPYRMKRVVAFLNPYDDPSSSGYQLIQSLIAVGSGGMFGEGLGGGKQKLFYLPAAHTDFIFAVIAEELGLAGALVVLVLFSLILIRGLATAQRLKGEAFLSCLALGCTLLIVIPAFLNMGVVIGLLPTKGMVLPLVAYGGTAIVVHLAAMGILVRLSAVEL